MGSGRRAVLIVAVMVALAAVLGDSAWARRPATPSERRAVTRAVQGRSYPAKCGVVYISTVDSMWASWQWVGNTPRSCRRYASNGIAIVHRTRGRWRVVTEGSAYTCPIAASEVYPRQPNVPDRVANDLVRYLHC